MKLTVLSIGYPFAPLGPDPVGGAEQVLARLDRGLTADGHRSLVIAPEHSSVTGELVAVPAVAGTVTEVARAHIHTAVRENLCAILAREKVDVVHLHGIDFDAYFPPPGVPVLATLHLPLDWYKRSALKPERPRVWLQPVSPSQAAAPPPGVVLAQPIENGVNVTPILARERAYCLALGRICPEKGFEDAIEAAKRVEANFLMAGALFPYPEHERYFLSKILPRLDRRRRWIGAVAGWRKKRLLAGARCVLVPSRVPETSSLVAMEALAAGTPVIAYRAGALPDIVEHGRTGFLVNDVEEMSTAIGNVDRIDPETCRRRAREHFSLDRMIGAYLDRYAELAAAA